MKSTLVTTAALAALVLTVSCAKVPDTGKNYLAKQYFDAWISVNHPDSYETNLGSRIINDQVGNGVLLGDSETTPYVYCDYQYSDLDGTINYASDIATAQRVGFYSATSYYGPIVFIRKEDRLAAGIDELFESMRVGGTRTAIIPGWLMTTDRYKNAEEYIKNATGDNTVCTFTVREAITDIVKWEIDSLVRYMRRHHPGVDSLEYGFYYIQTAEPLDTTSFEAGNNVYLDYTGRLLNGDVFDSTIADTTKKYRFYSDSRTYEPVSLKIPEGENRLTFTDTESETIQGFEKCVLRMKAGERGIGIFYSGLGYGEQSTTSIPSFSPLVFELHMLGLNEDGSIDKEE